MEMDVNEADRSHLSPPQTMVKDGHGKLAQKSSNIENKYRYTVLAIPCKAHIIISVAVIRPRWVSDLEN
jgi:hypothetical protein